MNILIYESSSRGGNFKYAIELFKAYRKSERFSAVELLIPAKSEVNAEPGIRPVLVRDPISGGRWITRVRFFFRNVANPFILFFILIPRSKTFVLFNDFEQSSAPLWSPLFRLFLRRHRYGVLLHDPDRDAYPPSLKYARFSMRSLMKLMHVGLYHDHLPDKPYYNKRETVFLSVRHGLYTLPAANRDALAVLNEFKRNAFLFAIVGNIRTEKNYILAIRTLRHFPAARLIIAGHPANSNVAVVDMEEEAKRNGVSERIFWQLRYLAEDEFAAVIEASDCILLNYAPSFRSQSGIINLIAPFGKDVIVSETESALTSTVRRFNLGPVIQPDSEEALIRAMRACIKKDQVDPSGWQNFTRYASWDNHVKSVADVCEKL